MARPPRNPDGRAGTGRRRNAPVVDAATEARARRQRTRERERREREAWFGGGDGPTGTGAGDGASAADAGAASLRARGAVGSRAPGGGATAGGVGASGGAANDVAASRRGAIGRRVAGLRAAARARTGGGEPSPMASTAWGESIGFDDLDEAPPRTQRRSRPRRIEDPAARRARELRHARLRKRARLGALVGGIVLAVALVWQVPQMGVFSVHQVAVQGTSAVSDLTIRQQIDPLLDDQTIYTADTDQIRRKVEALPFVRSATVDRHFPDGLSIRIVEYSPLAFAYAGNGGFLVARDGRVLTKARVGDWSDRVPVVRIDQRRLTVGDRVGDAPALRILRAVPATFPGNFSRIDVGQFGYVGQLVDGPEIRFGRDDDLTRKFRVVERLLGLLTPAQKKTLKYVDVSVTARPALGRQ